MKKILKKTEKVMESIGEFIKKNYGDEKALLVINTMSNGRVYLNK